MAMMLKEDQQDNAKTVSGAKKRKAWPDPELSTPRPRKLAFANEASENEDEPHVPTPTSSAHEDDQSDGEDNDIFRDRFRGQQADTQPQGKPSKAQEKVFATPAAKKHEVETPGTAAASQRTGNTEDL